MTASCVHARLRAHDNYRRLEQIACDSHARGRAPEGISERDVTLARLYCHAFRGEVIGSFHATRLALQGLTVEDPLSALHLVRADETLQSLANRSMDAVGNDARALVATFHHYCTHLARALDALHAARERLRRPDLDRIVELFVNRMEVIAGSNGIHLTRDLEPPPQGSFIVPNLGITIVPLVYGDHHSWNLAWLPAQKADVPYHQHHVGVEIHLGYGPMHGYTVLGDTKAELVEGYAMPIPPRTRHGYSNIGSLPHHVPFIFGSLRCGGWGVFLDVEPQPRELDQLQTAPVLGPKLNGTILLERELDKAAARFASVRYPLIPASATDRDGVGGLELSVARVTDRGLDWKLERFCAVSVVRGTGTVTIAGESRDLTPHDHFGIPAGVTAHIRQTSREPLVLLDCVIKLARDRS